MTSIVGKQSLGSLGVLQAGSPGKNASTAGQARPGVPTKAHILNTGDLAYLVAPVVRAPEEVGAVPERYWLQSGDLLFNVRNRPFRVSVVEAAGTQAPIVALGILASFRAHQSSALNPSYLAGLLRSTYGQQLVQPFMQTSVISDVHWISSAGTSAHRLDLDHAGGRFPPST